MDYFVGVDLVLKRARVTTADQGRSVVEVTDVFQALIDVDPGFRRELEAQPADLDILQDMLVRVEPATYGRGHVFGVAVRPSETSVTKDTNALVRELGASNMPVRDALEIAKRHGLLFYITETQASMGYQPPIDTDLADPTAAATAVAARDRGPKAKRLDADPNAAPQFTIDLTALGRDGGIDPVVGREFEIDRLSRILHRRRKPNPLLVGPPGVGKTAIVEGLAARIATDDVAPRLKSARILSVDFASMIGGTRYRGEFESRLQALIDAVLADERRPVLFIDEIQIIVGTGRAEGGMDASSILLPALARGQMCVIGATTPAEYEAFFAADTALARRFEPVFVTEPTADATLEIMAGLREAYEKHHGVSIDPDALEVAVTTAVAGAPTRHLPDKAIDLLDEACAMVAVRSAGGPGSRVKVSDIETVAHERGWL